MSIREEIETLIACAREEGLGHEITPVVEGALLIIGARVDAALDALNTGSVPLELKEVEADDGTKALLGGLAGGFGGGKPSEGASTIAQSGNDEDPEPSKES